MSLVLKLLRARRKWRLGKTLSCSVVIAAAGISRRMEAGDKLFILINGEPVLIHTLKAFQSCKLVNEIIVVVSEENLERVAGLCKEYSIGKATNVIIGGQTRLASVFNGVYAASKKADLIAIHDGARPCVDQNLISSAINTAAKHHAAAPAVPVNSTLKNVMDNRIINTVDRDNIFEVQTPQVFNAAVIKAALTNATRKSIEITDDCKALEIIGFPIRITEGSPLNIKLTTKEDIRIAEAILEGY